MVERKEDGRAEKGNSGYEKRKGAVYFLARFSLRTLKKPEEDGTAEK